MKSQTKQLAIILSYYFALLNYRAAPPPPDKRRVLKMSSFVEKDSVPKLAVNVVRWFNTVEAPKGVGKECDGTISVWFHGTL